MFPPPPPPTEPPRDDDSESIPRSAAFALAMRVVGAIFTGGLTLFLVRYLGADDYGVYALAISIGALLLLPADAGLSRSTARFIAERRGEEDRVSGVLRQAIALKAIGAGVVALALAAAAGPIAEAYDVSDLEWPLRIVALALVGQSFMLLFSTAFEALGRNALGFRLALSESAIEVGVSLTLVLAGAGVAGAAGGRAIGYGCGALVGLVLILRALGRSNLRLPASELGVLRIAGYAGALFLVDAAYAAFTQIDVLIIGAFLDARSAGLFSAPAQILLFTEYVGLALAAGVAPRLVRGEGREPNVGAFQAALRLLIVFQFVLVAPIVVWATPITDLLLGADYEESADVFRALGPFVLMAGPATLLTLGVNYLGEARRRVPLAIGAVAINAGLDAILIPEIGIVAGAIGTNVAFLFFIAGHVAICRDLIDLRLAPLGLALLRAGGACAAMAAVLFAFGTESLTAVEAVAGAVFGLATYALVLLLTREVSRDELAEGWAAARRLAS